MRKVSQVGDYVEVRDGQESTMCEILFFSSRRRHTRYIGDWSSDVCSSDLLSTARSDGETGPLRDPERAVDSAVAAVAVPCDFAGDGSEQIGRASCRETVTIAMGS